MPPCKKARWGEERLSAESGDIRTTSLRWELRNYNKVQNKNGKIIYFECKKPPEGGFLHYQKL